MCLECQCTVNAVPKCDTNRLFIVLSLSDLDKKEVSDAEMAEVMSSFINLICNFSDKMTNKIL